MGMFFNSMRKPRGFNHQYIYVNERKEKLEKMEEKAKRELGMLPDKEFSPEDIRGKFVEGTAKYFFEYLFFFRLQAFKELYYAFSAILSHMNEPATKETDNQCNKKTTNLKE